MELTETATNLEYKLQQNFRKLQSEFFKNPNSDLQYRLNGLKRLETQLLKYKQHITEAIKQDLNKCEFESDTSEILTCLLELRIAKRELAKWMRPKMVATPTELLGSSHYIRQEPKGVVLIISPWNYPVNLSIIPLIAAWSAGNKIILKPSEISKNTADVIEQLIADTFSSNEVIVCKGDVQVAEILLKLPFNHIFFTGSQATAKKVMKAAAENLSTVTLELGGKNPLIIDESINLKKVVKDIVYGKCINAGQTCVAPDYILIPKTLKTEFVLQWNVAIENLYGSNLMNNSDYGGIINPIHYDRLINLIQSCLDQGAVLSEPIQCDPIQRKIKPVLLMNSKWEHPCMADEIFGPVLPIIEYEFIEPELNRMQSMDRPLVLYIFSEQKVFIEKVLNTVRSGGVTINNCLLNYCNFNLPFGGDQQSGQGSNHGIFGFEAFSHKRGISKQGKLINSLRFFYPPFDSWKVKILNIAFKYLGKV
ncbi:MAG: aldehyde dehydrogenase family protein [Saprospiraceae bacterium]|nr:aldehyde dehydrogenase family protein [Saprospiraceae bacterium]